MWPIMCGIAVLVIIVLIALRLSLDKKEADESGKGRVIHGSGVYSVLRKSPREALAALRPTGDEIKAYLAGVAADVNGAPLADSDRVALLRHWRAQTEMNLRAVETGDMEKVAFYYYDYLKDCPVCAAFIAKGNFVSREEIYKYPQIVPPFHLGCACVLAAHHGSDKAIRETAISGMVAFFDGESPPPLPDWKSVLSLSTNRL